MEGCEIAAAAYQNRLAERPGWRRSLPVAVPGDWVVDTSADHTVGHAGHMK